MTKEEKDLLLKDLSARLPYGVKVQTAYPDAKILEGIQFPDYIGISDGYYSLDVMECKPCLFPLSSMTEEQREELYKIGWYLEGDKIYSTFRNYDEVNYKTHTDSLELVNWCYKNHIDINGLIEKGLALDATGLNIY